jgi:cobaltochelatase CobN
LRGEGRDDLVVVATSGSDGEGASTEEAPPEPPPDRRLPARFDDGKVAEALSPHSGARGRSCSLAGHRKP